MRPETSTSTLIVRTTARALTPVILMVSVYLLWRGHDAPGGGFIAALVAGAAVVLRYVAFGSDGVRRMLPVEFETLLGIGLAVALGSGLTGYAIDGTFLGGTVSHATLPVVGEIKAASSLVFDLGVYLIVLAVVVAIIRHLGEEQG